MEGLVGLIHVLTSPFILNSSKKYIMKYQKNSSKNTPKLCFVSDGLICVLTRQFITNNAKKCIMKSKKSISKNTPNICFVCELVSVEKQQINKQIHQISFCFYIVKDWMGAPINIIWFLEEPVSKSLYTSNAIE